ncbi:MAG: alpha/beta hydrolase [Chromatiales bacterium]|jgi:2-succinyl-6-hydroxy-2,4-cyclohexadiene-1-carboxylate synthase|nr:alpha/beta hydrolase [Chromatiales bacterium]
MTALHWEVHTGNGPHALLVHGFLSSRAQWRLNLEAFSAYCTPVVVELWGHGRSARPDDPNQYLPESYLAQFESIREAVGAERWLMCGQSLGASLTLRYALAYPERTIAQVFTNSNSALATEALTRQRRIDATGAIEAIERDGMSAVEALRVHPKHATRLPADVHAELVADAALIEPLAIADSYRYLNPGSSVRDQIGNLTVPTMLACGRYEKRFIPHREFAETAITDLRVVDLEAGHAVNIQAADAFDAATCEFFKEHLNANREDS